MIWFINLFVVNVNIIILTLYIYTTTTLNICTMCEVNAYVNVTLYTVPLTIHEP